MSLNIGGSTHYSGNNSWWIGLTIYLNDAAVLILSLSCLCCAICSFVRLTTSATPSFRSALILLVVIFFTAIRSCQLSCVNHAG